MGRTAAQDLFALAVLSRRPATKASALHDAVAAAIGSRGKIAYAHEGIVSAIFRCEPGEEAGPEVAEQIRRRVAATVSDPELSAGLGGPRRTMLGAYQAVLQAEHALVLGTAIIGSGRTISFGELGPYAFIVGQPRHAIREYCDRILGRLGAADGQHEELVRTVELYIRYRNVNEVARLLRLHRNTVRQRLQRVARMTGADLGDADSRLALHMALLGRRALAAMRRGAWIPLGARSSLLALAAE